ncbi:hypothetical protein Acr_28g0001190 [Actinidia rufa]|uniref:Uncharacterized protein n=1 Tax=Actinidia rufa TaxID=165716 RepID=A0A7J0H9H9_9ERIC|nr:hypothetical protein Acr_28g0001190 [Actinidia rufa]
MVKVSFTRRNGTELKIAEPPKEAEIRLNPRFDRGNEEADEALEKDLPLGTNHMIGGLPHPNLMNKIWVEIYTVRQMHEVLLVQPMLRVHNYDVKRILVDTGSLVEMVKEEREVLEDVGRTPKAKVIEDLICYELDKPRRELGGTSDLTEPAPQGPEARKEPPQDAVEPTTENIKGSEVCKESSQIDHSTAWKMFDGGGKNNLGQGLNFPATNEAEFHVFSDSKLIVNQVIGKFEARGAKMAKYLEITNTLFIEFKLSRWRGI